ncbi:unnamed protein product [Blepharisma stoltei]|uniref:Nudix hydrolase domain-containing protein n=1 Tax=Blepharisma stoltei TaxID=1481888 RepID=A0AAU9KS03_9CILI|nr:unnamed protein product [Blepharisma stoltei]
MISREAEIVHQGRWIKMHEVKIRKRNSKETIWYYVSRNISNPNLNFDCVDVLATIMENDINKLILIACYRVPVDRYVLEFPSGLVDSSDSSAAITALRELKEETGYTAHEEDIIHIGPVINLDPWKSTESTRFVYIRVNPDSEENRNPHQDLENEELITVELVPTENLLENLLILSEQKNYIISANLYNFALGHQRKR